ncbi:MAG: ACP S-malonyltransferase [Candidatus Omnitrophica bacterium]|nr:ACP S-malonyltransferase [Candidatus Omnitrophota bacterium]
MVAYLFAGQGSQYVGMGQDLYETFPESKEIFITADKTLGFALSKLCFEGPQEELTQTKNCQPAILTVSIAAYKAFILHSNSPSFTPSYVAGLSLGEYSALVAAGALSFEDAVYLTRKRGEFMEEAAQKKPGSMAAVIGLDLGEVKVICEETGVQIANLNCPGQVVISGGREQMQMAKELALQKGAKRVIILETSGAFHSRFMKEAREKLAEEINKIKINDSRVPVVCNVDAQATTSLKKIKENLIKQVTDSVLWEDSMRFILSKGVRDFIEFGPGKVLSGLMHKIEPDAGVRRIERVQDIKGAEA